MRSPPKRLVSSSSTLRMGGRQSRPIRVRSADAGRAAAGPRSNADESVDTGGGGGCNRSQFEGERPMKVMRQGVLAIALALAACGQQQQSQHDQGSITTPEEDLGDVDAHPPLPEVDPVLLAAPNTDFTAVEPSEMGISAAPTVLEAL